MKIQTRSVILLMVSVLLIGFYISKGNILTYLLKPYLETILSEQLDLKVEIRKLNFSLFNASINASDIHVVDATDPKNPRVVCHIPKMSASIQINQLLLGHLSLHKALIENPILSLQIKPQKEKKKKIRLRIPWTPLLHYEFNEIKIHKAKFHLKSQDVEMSQHQITFTINLQKHKNYFIQLDSEGGEIKYRDLSLTTHRSHFDGHMLPSGKVSGNINLQKIQFQEKILTDLSTDFTLENRSLIIKDFFLTPPTGNIRASASVHFTPTLEIDTAHLLLNGIPLYFQAKKENQSTFFSVHSPNINLSKIFTKKYKVEGKGTLKGEFFFKNNSVHIESNIEIHDASFENIYLGRLLGNISWKSGKTQMKLIFQHPVAPANGKLELLLSEHQVGSGILDAQQFHFFKEYFSKLSLPFSIKKNEISFHDAFLKKKNGMMGLTGTFNKNKKFDITLKSTKLSAEEFDAVPSFFKGDLSLSAHLFGDLSNPQAQATLAVPTLWVEQKNSGPSSIQLTLKNKILTTNVHLFNDQILHSGFIELTPTYPYQFSLEASHFDFTPYLFFLRKEFLELQSSLSGTLYIKGFLKEKKIIDGSIQVPHIKLSGSDFEFFNPHPISIEVKDNAFFLKSFGIEGTDTSLVAKGQRTANGEFSFLFEGHLNMALFQIFLPFVEKSSGKSKISCRLQGRGSDLTLFGNLALTEGGLKTQWFPHTIENLNANISFSKHKIAIDKCEGLLGGENFMLLGSIWLANLQSPHLDLQVTLSNNRLQFPDWLSSIVSGTLYLKGTQKPYLFSGKLMISEALYKENIDWQSQILSFKHEQYLPKIRDTEKPLFAVEISLLAPKNVYVKNNLADIETKTDLILKGNSDRLNLLGKIDLLSGVAFFKENRFKLNTAHLVFDNPVEIDPKFQIDSETVVKNYKIFLGIEGRLSKYKIHLASQPPLPESDIISLLTWGTTRVEVEKQGLLDLTQLELGSLFFGDIQKAVQTVAKKTLGVSFSLAPSYSDTKHTTVPRLFIGKTLTEKMDAMFSSTLDKSIIFSEKEFDLKYNINRNISLAGFWEDHSDEIIQDNSSFGVDLKVQFEFR